MYLLQDHGTHNYQQHNEPRRHEHDNIPLQHDFLLNPAHRIHRRRHHQHGQRETDCLIKDFSKAFDKVSHILLIPKLNHYGIRGKTNQWINGFLSNRKKSVVVEGEALDEVLVDSGVPHGLVLWPSLILFNIYDIKEKAYTSLIRPTVEYARAAWNPDPKTDIQKLEIIQRRATRFVQKGYHSSSVTELTARLANAGRMKKDPHPRHYVQDDERQIKDRCHGKA